MRSELQGEREEQNNGGTCCASEPSSYNDPTINNEEQNKRFCQFTLLYTYAEYCKESDPNKNNVPGIDDQRSFLSTVR
jgi:hypothetical protein